MVERSAQAPTVGSRTYFRLLSSSAQAWGTPESTALPPGIIAQPPFSTNAACSHELVFFSVVRLAAASALRWNWSTQIGAIAATTALLAVLSANSLAELPSVHPPQPKPMTRVAICAGGDALQQPRQRFSSIPHGILHDISSQFGEEQFLPFRQRVTDREGGALAPHPGHRRAINSPFRPCRLRAWRPECSSSGAPPPWPLS